MRSRREAVVLDERNWTCVRVQSPLGVVTLARKLPATVARPLRPGGTTWISRRFVPNTQRSSATKRIRWRR